MEARLRKGVRTRADRFGGVCYVPHRDDFFALDAPSFQLMKSFTMGWQPVLPGREKAVSALAGLGLCETRDPATREIAYSGPSFVGRFEDIVTVADPLVLNCFATSFCPLLCKYCHADDLMQEFRSNESEADIENVLATASMIPAMVAVVTGGDPLTRPARAEYLIRNLAKQKAIVLDTSGVGDFEVLLPTIKQYDVHVRVSIDGISEINDVMRPLNRKSVGDKKRGGALESACRVVQRCIEESVPITVQTVVTSQNSAYDELKDLKDWLIATGVQHWVLHMCVPAGSARRFNERAMKNSRPRLITPDNTAYSTVLRIIEETTEAGAKLDVRCTDTGNTPNSVLLVSSNGDLYTEGLARAGKNLLFEAGYARPDLIKSLWFYVDHFGHARRYLNWNAEFFSNRNLRDLCYAVPGHHSAVDREVSVVETEGKFRVQDIHIARAILASNTLEIVAEELQRDEYYDISSGALSGSDFVVRVRFSGGEAEVSVKGPRFWAGREYSRIELEFPARSLEDAQQAIAKKGLVRTWYFEKRRASYLWSDDKTLVHLDEIPEFGFFVEIEGPLTAVREVAEQMRPALGSQERRNYKELFIALKAEVGMKSESVSGAEFLIGK